MTRNQGKTERSLCVSVTVIAYVSGAIFALANRGWRWLSLSSSQTVFRPLENHASSLLSIHYTKRQLTFGLQLGSPHVSKLLSLPIKSQGH